MDPVSQGALGAVFAQVGAKDKKLIPATVLGLIAGISPDVDVFFRSSDDPLLFLEYHRQFTHSILFAPVGAFIIAIASWGVFRRFLSWWAIYVSCLLGFISHGFLDACTTYGTQLLWPFSDVRVAWNNISIIDPLFTLPIICFLALACFKRSKGFVFLGITWSLAYLSLGLVQKHRALEIGKIIASSRGHVPKRLSVKPSFANLLLWKSIYEYGDYYYIDGIRITFNKKVCPGEPTEKLKLEKHLSNLTPESQLAKDIERFRKFSNGYLAVKNEGRLVIDARYSMLPNKFEPLWGIIVDVGSNQNEYAQWWENKDVITAEKKSEFISLLFGENCYALENID